MLGIFFKGVFMNGTDIKEIPIVGFDIFVDLPAFNLSFMFKIPVHFNRTDHKAFLSERNRLLTA